MDEYVALSIGNVLMKAKEINEEAYLGLSLSICEVEYLTEKLNTKN